ncbi:NAD-dependent dehydratase [Mucilaginibacter sp. MD40]|uniref:SDR family oxidoreductase n=1 Tax=Mucilaginibacter sp. MD40 TaxID=2029590 RepID=UPI000BACE601|nr:SDR family oxidoreductase [Mucilaginibacter sp. MD40]PAW92309.1 NAD-dependent dehydratase [Mucilaginibacter sp. MD40]
MKNILILGASGQVARLVTERLSENSSVYLTLYLRDASRLRSMEGERIRLVEGDILDEEKLQEAMKGQDIVYVNINGQEDSIARQTITAMQNAGVKRLIFIAAIGIYHEVPGAFGQWNEQMIGPILERYRKAASLIEASQLEYTILRPTWYTNKDEVDYTISQKGEPVKGTEISRKSVADLVVRLIKDPRLHVNESLGMEKPGTEAEKPAFM